VTVVLCAGREPGVSFDRDVRPILSEYCFKCHGPDAKVRKAELRLDTRAGLFRTRKDTTVIVAGDPEHSELLRRVRANDDDRMPPASTKRRLSAAQIAVLRAWIEQGAKWEAHWSFEKPVRPELPDTAPDAWSKTPIDRFVLARLRAEHMSPAPEAERRRWLRRVTFDLTGLPPTRAEITAFLADEGDGAFERVVDRLLASPRYGERMAWDWLDAARYADTNGYQGDKTRTMWPYRDWVVAALNRNLRYDEFVTWQLAGDLLPDATFEQKLATAFLRNHMINGEGGRIPEENRVEYIFDQVETVGTTWLGLTLTCCRCHDHKYDPLSQRNYYELFAYFNQTPVTGAGDNPQTPPVLTVRSEADRRRLATLRQQLDRRQREVETAYLDSDAAYAVACDRRDAARSALEQFEKRTGKVRVMVMADRTTKRRETYVLQKGLYNQRREKVTAGVPDVLPPLPNDAPANRLGLARWLVAADNPLLARVVVNRHWQRFFGAGLVKTVEDFGAQGQKPTHPKLLDWLATEFVRTGFDVKALHRLIVLSATYRQSAKASPEQIARDPDNRLLARGPRHRLPSWMIRDAALAVSGLLVEKLGGPPVHPYQPDGVWAEATFGKSRYVPDKGSGLYRRSLYTFWRRIIGPTMFFDTPKRQTCSVRVSRTNTPLHALVTLNDTTYVEAARALAQRLLLARGLTTRARIAMGFELVTSRLPAARETDILARRLEALFDEFTAQPERAKRLLATGRSRSNPSLDPVEHAAWTGLCSLLLNLDEALSN